MRLQFAQHHVAVSHRQRPAATIAGRAGVGAGAFRPDLKAAVAVEQDRPAAGRDGVNVHHWRAHPDACDLGLKAALIGSGIVADIGGGAAHVEADQAVMARKLSGLDHADDTACRAGKDRVLALKQTRIGQPAI